jgi:hypothetical protein
MFIGIGWDEFPPD